jgi:hypothetical protein
MQRRAAVLPLVLLLGIILAGCEPQPPAASVSNQPPPPPPPGAAPEVPEPEMERVKAEAGVGAKGRSLDQHEGLVVTPIKAYFAARERIAFVAQFQHQYDLYKAMADDVPKDFDDLTAKVLEPFQIKLPQLPPGHRYVWDAAKEELQVERPRPGQ